MENENGMKFRTALGGFDRRDVIAYIERSAKNARAREEQLKKELRDTKAERDRLLAQLNERDSVRIGSERREQELRESYAGQLEEFRSSFSQVDERLNGASSTIFAELSEVSRSIDELRALVAGLSPDMVAAEQKAEPEAGDGK